jgi:hypothetical protein
MIDQAQLDADKQALQDATVKLASDQAAYDAAQPHLTVWQEVEAHAVKWGGEAEAELKVLVAKGRELVAKMFA